jgi:hypothetical protein
MADFMVMNFLVGADENEIVERDSGNEVSTKEWRNSANERMIELKNEWISHCDSTEKPDQDGEVKVEKQDREK